MGVLLMIPLRRALIVKEHGRLTYPEGTACAEVLVAGEKGGLQARRLFQAFGLAFTYKFLMSGLKAWKEYPGWTAKTYTGASISAEVSPELMGVGYIIGPRIAGYLFAGGTLAYLVLIPAIKLFGSGLTKPIFAETKLIADMSPGEVRANFVFYIGAGAVATAGIIALVRSLPTIVAAFRSGFQDLRGSLGDVGSRLRTDVDLPIWVTPVGALALALVLTAAPAAGGQSPRRDPDHRLRLLLRGGLVPHHRRDRGERESDLGDDHRGPDRHRRHLPGDRLDRGRSPGRRPHHRGRHRRGRRQRRRHQPGPQDRVPGGRHAPAAADRHHDRSHHLGAGHRLDPHPAQQHLHHRSSPTGTRA